VQVEQSPSFHTENKSEQLSVKQSSVHEEEQLSVKQSSVHEEEEEIVSE